MLSRPGIAAPGRQTRALPLDESGCGHGALKDCLKEGLQAPLKQIPMAGESHRAPSGTCPGLSSNWGLQRRLRPLPCGLPEAGTGRKPPRASTAKSARGAPSGATVQKWPEPVLPKSNAAHPGATRQLAPLFCPEALSDTQGGHAHVLR